MAELSKRTVVSVSWIGKWKTTIQMFAIAGVIWQQADWMVYASVTLLYVAALLTVISMVQYLHAAWNDLIADM
jgi:CDP-diacylglycerol--glycerol-3-phosphate 3-phosphatidyltransferase